MNKPRRPRHKPANETEILAELDGICARLSPDQAERALEWLAHKHIGPLDDDRLSVICQFTEGYGVKRGDLVKFEPVLGRNPDAPVEVGIVNDAGIPIGKVLIFDKPNVDAVRPDCSVILWEVLKTEKHEQGTIVLLDETDENE